jgi:hypothetical protein
LSPTGPLITMSEIKTEGVTTSHGIEAAPEGIPSVAVGDGLAAKREGTKIKRVYNVSTSTEAFVSRLNTKVAEICSYEGSSSRLSSSPHLRRQKLRHGARTRSTCTVSVGHP